MLVYKTNTVEASLIPLTFATIHLVRERERDTVDIYDTVIISILFATIIACIGTINRWVAWCIVLPPFGIYVAGRIYRAVRFKY